MLKHTMTYTDFNDEKVTETLYFNLSKPELLEYEADYEGGIEKVLQNIIDAQDKKTLILEFKKIILLSYGVKTPDGKRFIKTDEDRIAFEQTAAYQQLFMDLATDDKLAAEFVNGVIPKDLREEVEKAKAENPGKTTAEIARDLGAGQTE